MAVQHVFANPQHLVYLYLLIVACGGLVVLCDLLAELDQVSSRALARARLAQAEADIVSQSNTRGEPHELIASAVRRVGSELGADIGVAFVVRDGEWCGEAVFGSAVRPALAVLSVRGLGAVASRARRQRGAVDPRRAHLVCRAWPDAARVPARLRAAARARRAAAGLRSRPWGHGLQPGRGDRAVHARAGALRRQRRQSRGRGRRERPSGRRARRPAARPVAGRRIEPRLRLESRATDGDRGGRRASRGAARGERLRHPRARAGARRGAHGRELRPRPLRLWRRHRATLAARRLPRDGARRDDRPAGRDPEPRRSGA